MSELNQMQIGAKMERNKKISRATDIFTGGTIGTKTLYELIKDYESGNIRIPDHQRESSWPDKKKKAYVDNICKDPAPPGSFEIYTIVGEDGYESVEHLNDGVQRLLTAKDFLDHPLKYGVSVEDADFVLRRVNYPFRKKKHRSHQEASIRFQEVNSNIPLTPYQFTLGKLIYCLGDSRVKEWRELIENINSIVDKAIIRITGIHKASKKSVALIHKARRQSNSLFLRFLANDKEAKYYSADSSVLNPSDNFFETELAEYFVKCGPEEIKKQVDLFENRIVLDSGTISNAWRTLEWFKRGESIKPTMVRWLFDLCIFSKNCDVPNNKIETFIKKVLEMNHGATDLSYFDKKSEKQKRINFMYGRVGVLFQVSDVIGYPEFKNEFLIHREKSNKQLESGYQNSHYYPYKDYGNGETFPEPGSKNMARGAKVVELEDLPVRVSA